MATIHTTSPLRIKQARKIACLSLRALSDRIGISHTQLGHYENGQAQPSASVLIKIANALGVSVEFFFRKEAPKLGEIHFRKKSKLSNLVATAIEEKSKDFFSKYFEIEEIAGRERIAFPRQPADERKSPEDWADWLRGKWNLGDDPIPNLQQLLENKGVKIFEVDQENEAFDGLSAYCDKNAFLVISSWLKKDLPRKRMTLAHELGHLLVAQKEQTSAHEHEIFAKEFATAFLMPKNSFSKMLGGQRSRVSVSELLPVKRYFGVSLAAIVMRANRLGLLKESAKKSFFIRCGKNGWRKNEPGEYLGEESSSRFVRLVKKSVQENEISESKGAELLSISIHDLRKDLADVV